MNQQRDFLGGGFLIESLDFNDLFTPEDFTEEQKLIRDTSREFIKNEVLPNIDKLEGKDHPLALSLLEKAGELGLNATNIPEQYGGLELDKVSTTIVTEELGSTGSFSVVHAVQTGIGLMPIVYFGTEAQKQKFLPGMAEGTLRGAYCLTEADAGSDALSARTKAVLSEDKKHYILNGEKQFITNAGIADVFIVYAKVEGEFSCFLVEKDTPGLSVGKEEDKMGMRGSSTCSVVLEDVSVPIENVLFQVGKGHKIAFNVLNLGRWKLGAAVVGQCKQSIGTAIQYANERVQFGSPIATRGLIKDKISQMAAKTYMAESVMYRIAGMIDDKLETVDPDKKHDGEEMAKAIEEYAVECSIAKILGSECLDYVVDQGVQIHGGYGYMVDYEAERHYRDARINRIWEGTNEINRMLIFGTLIKRTLKGRLPLMAAAQAIPKELLSYSPLAVKLPDGPLALQEHMLAMTKKTVLLVAGAAVMKFSVGLSNEQEILSDISDIVIEIFAMESGLMRALKIIDKQGEEAASYHIAAIKIYMDAAIVNIEQIAKHLAAYIATGDELKTLLAGIKKLLRYQPVDTITLKRQLAEQLSKREKYIF